MARERVGPDRLAEALGGWAGEGRDRRAHAAELVALARRYDAALERTGRVDEDAFAWRALDALRRAPHSWGGAPVFLYGFDDLTSVQRDAVRALADAAGAEVTVSLPYEPRAGVRRPGLDGRGAPLGRRGRGARGPRGLLRARKRAAELHHLERWLFEDEAPRIAPGGAVAAARGGRRAGRGRARGRRGRRPRGRRDGARGRRGGPSRRAARGGAARLRAVGARARGWPPSGSCPPATPRSVAGWSACSARRWIRPRRRGDLLAWLRTPGVLERPELADGLELTVRQRGLQEARAARAVWEELVPTFRLGELDGLAAAAREGAAPADEGGRSAGLIAAARDAALRLFTAPYAGRAPVLDEGESEDARVLAAVLDGLAELEQLDARGSPGRAARACSPGYPSRSATRPAPGRSPWPTPSASAPAASAPWSSAGCRPASSRLRRGPSRSCPPRPGRPSRPPASASAWSATPRAEERYLFYACASRPTERALLSRRALRRGGQPRAALAVPRRRRAAVPRPPAA